MTNNEAPKQKYVDITEPMKALLDNLMSLNLLSFISFGTVFVLCATNRNILGAISSAIGCVSWFHEFLKIRKIKRNFGIR